jgi:hypothetical protein
VNHQTRSPSNPVRLTRSVPRGRLPDIDRYGQRWSLNPLDSRRLRSEEQLAATLGLQLSGPDPRTTSQITQRQYRRS